MASWSHLRDQACFAEMSVGAEEIVSFNWPGYKQSELTPIANALKDVTPEPFQKWLF